MALDAALSSPSGRGVAVDATGAVIGSVFAHDVLSAIEQSRLAGDSPRGAEDPPNLLRKAGVAS